MSKFLEVIKAMGVTGVKFTSKQSGYTVRAKVLLPTALTREAVVETVKTSVAVVTVRADGEDNSDDKYATDKMRLAGDRGAAKLAVALGIESKLPYSAGQELTMRDGRKFTVLECAKTANGYAVRIDNNGESEWVPTEMVAA